MSEYKYNSYLEARLQLWSWWYTDIANGNVGWPSSSIIAVIKELGTFIKSSRPSDIPTNQLAEEVNTWVKQMGKMHPELELALRAYYSLDEASLKSKRRIPLKSLAKNQGISLTLFKGLVKNAKFWLSGRVYPETENFHGKLGIV